MLNRDEAIRLLRSIAGYSDAEISESDDGLTVQIRLKPDPAPAPPARPVPQPSHRYRVLHVEDVDRASDLIYYYLRNKYDVDTEQTAETALERAMEIHYDFILMDLNLGKGMNGFELTELLRKTDRYATVPIVAISGYTTRKDVDRSIVAGCNAFLSKPFLKDDLLRLLHHLEAKFGLSSTANTNNTGTGTETSPVSAPLRLDGTEPIVVIE